MKGSNKSQVENCVKVRICRLTDMSRSESAFHFCRPFILSRFLFTMTVLIGLSMYKYSKAVPSGIHRKTQGLGNR